MAVIDWRLAKTPAAEREYLVLLSYLPLARWRGFPRFLNYARVIDRQLRTTQGVIGYSLRAAFLKRRFWTLSVWEDERALMAFVRTAPHVHAMGRLRQFVGSTRFVRWRVRGSEVPPSWEDAMRHLASISGTGAAAPS